jgi:hypothetical protein
MIQRTLTLPAALIATALLLLSAASQAGPAADTVIKCVSDNTTGKDRKELARWIFLAMAAHPELRDLAASSNEAEEHSSKTTGVLFTKLIADSCPTEFKAMIKAEGPQSMRVAFEALGQLAMQELMTNKNVMAGATNFERHVDKTRVSSVLDAK